MWPTCASTQSIGTLCAELPTLQTQSIRTQVPVHPTSAELPNFQHFNPTDRQAHKYLCGQHTQNFRHFNRIDRYTSTFACNIRRTSNTSTQPIGKHTSTCAANFSEGKRILTHKCKLNSQHTLTDYMNNNLV